MRCLRTPLLLVPLLLVYAHASAQQASIPVLITITDPSGAQVPGAQIRIVPAPYGEPRLITNDKGQVAVNLKPGGYALFARAQGFRTLITHFDVRPQSDRETISGVLEIAQGGGPTVVSPAGSTDLAVFSYPYHEPAAFTPSQIHAMPHVKVTIHHPDAGADETYSGVRLADLLAKLGVPLGKELHGDSLAIYVTAHGSDGYEALLSLAEIDPEFHPGEVIVADAMNGKPLDSHDGPLKLVVSEDKRPARCVRNLVTIDVLSSR